VSAATTIIGTPYTGTHTLGNWQSDDAYDIATPVGTPMTAAADGVVTKVTKHPQGAGRFAGDQITIHTSDGNAFFYAHGVASVTVGQHVKEGEKIGTSGSANGVAHLHFGALKNPKAYLSKVLGGADAPAPSGPIDTAKNAVSGVIDAGKGVVKGAQTAADVGASVVDFLNDPRRALLYLLLLAGGAALAVTGLIYALGSSPGAVAQRAGRVAAIGAMT
jgi:hypothetical protein